VSKKLDHKELKLLEDFEKKVKKLQKHKGFINPYESKEEQQARIKRAKEDFQFFCSYYLDQGKGGKLADFHIRAAEQCKADKNYTVWRKWGRGLMKSGLTNFKETLWLWINDEIHYTVIIHKEADKAAKWVNRLRANFTANERLIHDFGEQYNMGEWTKDSFVTKNGYICEAMGMDEEARGMNINDQRPDHLIFDDWEDKKTLKNPSRQDDYAHWAKTSVALTAGADGMRIIIPQNHFHPRLIAGLITGENDNWESEEISQFESFVTHPDSDWIIHRVDAYNPTTYEVAWDFYKPAYYIRMERKVGDIEAIAEYNNKPFMKGKTFKEEMIQWEEIPDLATLDTIVGFWDVAPTSNEGSDCNAARVWGNLKRDKYLIDCFVDQAEIYDVVWWIAEFIMSLPKGIEVEFYLEKQFWDMHITQTIEEVEKELGIVLNIGIYERSTQNKNQRIKMMHPQYQRGRIYWNAKKKNNRHFVRGKMQFLGFDPSKSNNEDDALDADKYAWDIMEEYDTIPVDIDTITACLREDRTF